MIIGQSSQSSISKIRKLLNDEANAIRSSEVKLQAGNLRLPNNNNNRHKIPILWFKVNITNIKTTEAPSPSVFPGLRWSQMPQPFIPYRKHKESRASSTNAPEITKQKISSKDPTKSLNKPLNSTLIFQRKKIQTRYNLVSDNDYVVIHIESTQDILMSPCKIVMVKEYQMTGYNLYKCAPRKDQLNRFKNLECKTIMRHFAVEANRNGKVDGSYHAHKFPIGCELRFKRSKKNCNRLMIKNNKGC